jgi:hypothetical protein
MSISLNGSMLTWGGFAYPSSNPSGLHIFDDGYRLSRTGPDGSFQWTPLPKLPNAVADAGMCAIGSVVYSHGGADFSETEQFCYDSMCDGSGVGLGRMLFSLDTAKLSKGATWQALKQCPGTPRAWHQVNCIGDKVFVMGGSSAQLKNTTDFKVSPAAGRSGTIANVIDNWSYDTVSKKWERLRDMPTSGTVFGGAGGGSVFRDEKIMLINSYQYDRLRTAVADQSEVIRPPYGVVTHAPTANAPLFDYPKTGLYFNDVFVYSTRTDMFGYGDGLPINDASPDQIQLNDSAVIILGGETGAGFIDRQFFGQHPDLVMVATMRESV